MGNIGRKNLSTFRIITLAIVAAAIVTTTIVLLPSVNIDPNPSGGHYKGDTVKLSVVAASSQQQTTLDNGISRNMNDNNATLTLAELFNKTQQSVVQVSVTLNETSSVGFEDGDDDDDTSPFSPSPEPPPSELIPQRTLGSGFVYDKEGHIITNSHVVMLGNKQRVDVTFSDGTIYRATVVGVDQYSDLAVLHVDDVPEEKLTPLSLGNSSGLFVGQPVAAIGNPFGLSGSLSEGIISGLDRLIPAGVVPEEQPDPSNMSSLPSLFSIPNVIQTDAPINPGNSGGPLLDMQSNVIGINTAIFSTTGVFGGVGFAVPSNTIAKIVPVLIEKGSYEHPWLGISGIDMSPEIAEAIGLDEPRGFLVIGVEESGPADEAGIIGGSAETTLNGRRDIPLGGDVILSIDNTNVRKIDDLLGYLEESTQIGQNVTLTVWRDGETMQIDLTLAARPAAATTSAAIPRELP